MDLLRDEHIVQWFWNSNARAACQLTGRPKPEPATDTCEGVPQIMKSETHQIGPVWKPAPTGRWRSARGFIVVGTRDDKLPEARQVFPARQGQPLRVRWFSFLSSNPARTVARAANRHDPIANRGISRRRAPVNINRRNAAAACGPILVMRFTLFRGMLLT